MKRTTKWVISFICFLTYAGAVSFLFSSPAAEPVRFERMPLREGVSQSIITAIIQDNRGFMWFGTEDGLNKYDGYKYTVYRYNPSRYNDPHTLTGITVETLYEDSAGFIWVGTRSGLDKYDPSSGTFVHFRAEPGVNGKLGHNVIKTVCEGPGGNIWIGTEGGGVDKLDPETGVFTHVEGLGSEFVNSICTDNNGMLWIGTHDGLDKLDPVTGKVDHFYDGLVKTIYRGPAGKIWLGVSTGVDWFDPDDETTLKFAESPRIEVGQIVNTFCRENEDYLWFGTEGGGLCRMNPGGTTFRRFQYDPADPLSISESRIRALCLDRSGILWIGTYSGGIDKMNPRKNEILHLRHEPENPYSLSHNIVFSICEFPEGIFWIGTDGGGLNRWDREAGRFTAYRHDPRDRSSLSNDYVVALAVDADGLLWVGTHAGVDRFDPRTGKFRHYILHQPVPGILSGSEMVFLLEDREKDIWACSYGGGLYRLARETGEITRYRHKPGDPDSLSTDILRTIYEDRDGTLWVGTLGGGLNRFNRETGTFTAYRFSPSDPSSISSDIVIAIHQDVGGALWVVTYGGGLNKLDPISGQFTRYTSDNGFPTNSLYGILEDYQGNLWISSNYGISCFDPISKKIKNYNRGDGLQGNEFNGGSYFESSTGEFFFGGINGFNVFHPEKLTINPHVPPVVITSFKILNRDVEFPGNKGSMNELTLSHRDYEFSFEFAALDYSVPEKNGYAYKMVGLNPKWVEVSASRRFVSFTTLPPGDYVFRVIGSNSDGVWNREGVSINITVRPPYWQSWWFRGLAVLLGLVFIFYWHQKRMKILSTKLKDEARLGNIYEKYNISDREKDVLELVFKGKTNREIEDELFISLSTVKNHVYKIYKKTGVKNRYQLMELFGQIPNRKNFSDRKTG